MFVPQITLTMSTRGSQIKCTICTITSISLISLIIFLIVALSPPFNVKFDVTNVPLMQFNLTSNNTLYYNFKVNITSRNSNNHGKIYYRRITAVAWYKDNDFAWVSLTPFDQRKKNTTLLGPIVFEGNYMINLKSKQLDEYKEERRIGIYNDLAVDLEIKIKSKYGGIKSNHYPLVQCRRLSVPFISNDESSPTFNVTRCKNRWQRQTFWLWSWHSSSRSRSKLRRKR